MNLTSNMNVDTGEKTWLTPPSIIEALGPFDLDPCCPSNMPWRTATQMISLPDNGLLADWSGKRVWCNPPYGREAIPFLRKMAENTNGGGILSYLRGQTPPHGKISYFHTHTVYFFYADALSFTKRMEHPERQPQHRLRSLRIQNGILSVFGKVAL